jgi:hypothetical protein
LNVKRRRYEVENPFRLQLAQACQHFLEDREDLIADICRPAFLARRSFADYGLPENRIGNPIRCGKFQLPQRMPR